MTGDQTLFHASLAETAAGRMSGTKTRWATPAGARTADRLPVERALKCERQSSPCRAAAEPTENRRYSPLH